MEESFFQIGRAYFLQTVTHYYTGRVEAIQPDLLVLSSAAWIADTGRFHNAISTGQFDEVEPILGRMAVSLGGLIAAIEWPHALPDKQK